jgi:hypothetical protein
MPQLMPDTAKIRAWHEVKKVNRYYLSAGALPEPMQVRDPTEPYGNPRG